jgi:DNA-directed RNA polymerase subunit omega
MARITSQKATEVYGNKFELVLAASQRAREIKNGSTPKVESSNGPIITALKEIEEGKYTRKDFLSTLNRKGKNT